ncbi:MAG: DUF4199 domain-containing protein [Chitinophagaceae bacterium]|nr:DUF4199 domain-containing protein [Chitinophagaceae bacterium]
MRIDCSGCSNYIHFSIVYFRGILFCTSNCILSLCYSNCICRFSRESTEKEQGGYLEFSQALKTVFTVFVIWSFFATAFSYVLLNFIDVPFREAMAQQAAEKTEEFMTKFGAPQKDIDKAVEEALNGNNSH